MVKNRMRHAAAVLLLCTIWRADAEQDQYSFGQPFDFDQALEISSITDASQYIGKRVAITGQVNSVCEKSHCWMTLESGRLENFRIKVDDQVMVFPISAKKKSVFAEGVLEEWTQPPKISRGYQLKATSVFIVH